MSCKNNSLDINPGHIPRNREEAARHLLDPSPTGKPHGHDPSGISRVSGQTQANYMGYGYPTAPAGGRHRPAFVPFRQEKFIILLRHGAMAGARNRTEPERPAR